MQMYNYQQFPSWNYARGHKSQVVFFEVHDIIMPTSLKSVEKDTFKARWVSLDHFFAERRAKERNSRQWEVWWDGWSTHTNMESQDWCHCWVKDLLKIGGQNVMSSSVTRSVRQVYKRSSAESFLGAVRAEYTANHKLSRGRSWHKHLHHGRLTWNIIMEVWKIIFLSKWVICRFQPLIFQGV